MASLQAWLGEFDRLAGAGVDGVGRAVAILTGLPQHTTLGQYSASIQEDVELSRVSAPWFVVGHALSAARTAGFLLQLGRPELHLTNVDFVMIVCVMCRGGRHMLVDLPLHLRSVECVEFAMPGFSEWALSTLDGRGGLSHQLGSDVADAGACSVRSWWVISKGQSRAERLPLDMEADVDRAWAAGSAQVICKAGGDRYVIDLVMMACMHWDTQEQARLLVHMPSDHATLPMAADHATPASPALVGDLAQEFVDVGAYRSTPDCFADMHAETPAVHP